MIIELDGFTMEVNVYDRDQKQSVNFTYHKCDPNTLQYELSFESHQAMSARVEIQVKNEKKLFHLIPCNIHGDNNLDYAKPGYFPNLTHQYPESDSCNNEWEFRADRASHPVSIITCENGAVGISIDPYTEASDTQTGFIRNGIYAKLDDVIGVSLGYQNIPLTFTNKEDFRSSTGNKTKKAKVSGFIYAYQGDGKTMIKPILQHLYQIHRTPPKPQHSYDAYLNAFMDSFENINWSDEHQAFTNMACRLPEDTQLKAWRPLIEIGWTGTGVICYPLLSAHVLTQTNNGFTSTLIKCFDRMVDQFNEKSGLFNDLTQPRKNSMVNGWWAGYMVSDCHCAYTNGNGIYYLLKAYMLLRDHMDIHKEEWLKKSLKALDTICSLQKSNGNFGYTYDTQKPKMLDEDGFAGVWFVPALALAYQLTNDPTYLDCAIKGIGFYHSFVTDLQCWGTPMDTWKSIDQEGNLGFIRGARLLHQITKEHGFLSMMEDSAHYEYLWRYAIKAKPECPPLQNSSWNSTGGSVTSVSNPHIHPMGVYITSDLFYLHRTTQDTYHKDRAYDGLLWGLATADLYPNITGYGQLGVMTERYCPSDGLTIEKYADTNQSSSIWFTFNGWASAAVLEGLTESLLDDYIQK